MSESKDQREFVLNASDVMPIKVGPDPLTNGLAPETIFDVLKKTCAERGDQVAQASAADLSFWNVGPGQVVVVRTTYDSRVWVKTITTPQ